jgi:hypothetical protein
MRDRLARPSGSFCLFTGRTVLRFVYILAAAFGLLLMSACGGGWGVRPEIVQGPVNQTVTSGQSATFSATATGTAPLSYQWYENGAPISGATSPSYTTPPTTGSNNGSVFMVMVTDAAGAQSSLSAMLTVELPPVMTKPPVSVTVNAGQTATFSTSVTGTAPLSYQWLRNGSAIVGATASSYTTPVTSGGDSGSVFSVTVSNLAGTITSSAAELTVNVPPTITLQPVTMTVNAGATAMFSVAATGTAPLSYQWYRGGAAIPGAVASSYTTAATSGADNGVVFTVMVSNVVGAVTSAAATLNVHVGPTITLQPLSQTVNAGQTATFSVAATGTHPMTYQWYLNGTAIAGATASFYTTPAVSGTNSGAAYTVTVTNVAGTATSAPAVLTVNVAPTITLQPVSQTVVSPTTAIFSVAATGTAPLSYQWFMDGAAISGATASSYTTAATSFSNNGALYTVVVRNTAGSVTSAAATLTVNTAPTITLQPVSETVVSPQAATFSVAAKGTSPLSYQWFVNGASISGATSSSYTAAATSSSNNGTVYTVVVSNVAGSVTSMAATLTVNSAPTITMQPVSQTVVSPMTATFSVAATGTAPLSYQWFANGAPIGEAMSSTYTTPATSSSNNGALYTVTVTNATGTVTSAGATLTVNSAPTITLQPMSQTVVSPAMATFSVTATGTAPLSYQWSANGIPIVGATSSNYTTAATTSNNNGTVYTVAVTNTAGSVTSSTATLTVNAAPAITLQPMSQTVVSPAMATFSVTATGTAPLSYQWFANGAPIVGATSSSYTTAATTSNNNGTLYTVMVTNTVGSVTSTAATLTVNTVPTILAQPVSQTVTAPATATFSVVASGSGTLMYQWFLNGAAISGATSSTFTTPATTATGSVASYTVKVSNATGMVTSTAATLTVDSTPQANGLSCSPASPAAGATITLVPNFSGGTAVIGSAGFGSSDIAASVVSGMSYTSAAVRSATTFSLTVTGTSGSSAVSTCTTTPMSVSITPISPAMQTVGSGPQTFTATATGGVTNGLTWSASGGSFSGNVWTPPTTPGTYTITATSVDEPSVAVTTTMTVNAPVITSQPVSKNACVGHSASLSVGANFATGFEWTSLPVGAIGNATGSNTSTLSFTNLTTANNGSYSCQVSGAGSVTSNTVTLNVVSATTLTITSQPASVSVFATQTATFSVSATGTGALTYQWFTGAVGSGTAISGATSSTYTTPALTATSSGTTYYVEVTDPDCTGTTLTSSGATLTVSGTDTAVPPTIVVQPVGETATVGGMATFSVIASGSGTLTYQWFRVAFSSTELTNPTAGVLIPEATSSTYTTPVQAQSNDGDSYYVVVTNDDGSALSNRAVLAVGAGILLQITAEPQSDSVGVDTLASFSVGATCTGCIPAYQWFMYAPGSSTATALTNGAVSSGALNGATVSGATTSSLTLGNVPAGATNSIFYVVITSTSDGTTQISGTNPLTSSTAGLFVGALGTIGNTEPGMGLCNASSGTNWVLRGTNPGTTSGDVPFQNTTACTIEMTDDQGGEQATVYWPTLISTAKFSVSFTVQIAHDMSLGIPADGFTMVLADPSQGATTSSVGGVGEGMGADGIPGFVLGFDTFQNGDLQTGVGVPCGFPACDPIAVPYMAVGQGATSLWENPWSFVNGDLDTQNSTDFTAEAFANATHAYVVTVVNNIMTVTIDGSELFTGTVSLPPTAFLGFTASTGSKEEAVTFSNLTATVSAP